MMPMIPIKMFREKAPLIFATVFLLLSFAGTNNVHAIGDLGIVVEKMSGSPGEIKKCSVCGRYMKVGNIPKGAEATINSILRESFSERIGGYGKDKNNGNYVHLLIYRYEERIGGNLGVDKPAGAGFHMHLIENNVLKRVFTFDEDQEALSENLFNLGKFLRRGAKWLTVEELCRDAISRGLDIILEDYR